MFALKLEGTFHDAIGPILVVARIFGLMPVSGVESSEIKRIKFHWKSVKSIYSLIFIVCGTVELICLIRFVLNNGLTLGHASNLSFYVASMLGTCCFFRFAMNWKRLMKLWYESEKVFLKAPYVVQGWSLKCKLRVWAAVLGFVALGMPS